MENERLKLWLNFWRFVLGSVTLTLISTLLNHQIQKARLEMEAQSIEDSYIQQFLSNYMASGYKERTTFVNFLRFVTTDGEKRKNYDSLYAFLVDEIAKNELQVKLETDSISALQVALMKKQEQVEKEQGGLIALNQRYKTVDSQTEKAALAKELKEKNKFIDSLELLAQRYQNKIVEKENLTVAIKKDISNPVKDQPEISFNDPVDLDLQKGESFLIKNLDVTIVAQKVNNITNKALVWIKTGEYQNNPSYSLGINKYAIFSKGGMNYKLLVTNIYNDGGIDHSRVEMTLSKSE